MEPPFSEAHQRNSDCRGWGQFEVFIGVGMGRSRRYKRRLRVHRVAAANHRIRRPGRCGIRSIRRRDPGIRESSRAHRLKRMELRSCRGDPSRPTSPLLPLLLHPSISFSLFPRRGYRRCSLEFYLFVGGGGRGAWRLWVAWVVRIYRGIYFGVLGFSLDPLWRVDSKDGIIIKNKVASSNYLFKRSINASICYI